MKKLWILLAMAFALSACAEFQKYPGAAAYKTVPEKKLAYEHFAIHQDPDSFRVTAQDKTLSDAWTYGNEVAPALAGTMPGVWQDIGWHDLALLLGIGAAVTQYRQPWGEGLFLGADILLLGDLMGHIEERNERSIQAFDQALSQDLGLPDEELPFAVAGEVRPKAHWDLSLASGAIQISALDQQAFFTPPGGRLNFRFEDDAFNDLSIGLNRRWTSGFSLGLEAEVGETRRYGVLWNAYAGHAAYDETIEASQVIGWLRAGQLWRPWSNKRWSLEGIFRIGWAVSSLIEKNTDPADPQGELGRARYRGDSPAWALGLGLGFARIAFLDLQLELGYRSSRTGVLSLRDSNGDLQNAPAAMQDPYGRPAVFDFSGPYARLGIMNF